jgi:REP element-mobilizing transposase RayT
MLSENPQRESTERSLMSDDEYRLAEADRRIVLVALKEHCRFRRWVLHAVHVRKTHVHLVVAANENVEAVLGQLKAYASRALNRAEGIKRKRWSHRGSTRYLWSAKAVDDTVGYVVGQDGVPMTVYVNPRRWQEGF